MFYYLKGTAAHLGPNLAVIDCGGVGYACRTTSYTLSALQIGAPAQLYTHLNVREDAMELYGFSTENERNCFQMLIAVSGVGPKAALSILSATTPEGLATAIITGNEKALMVAQGIGKKTAQRIILELKDKLAQGQIAPGEESYGGTGVTVIPQDKASEATAALAVLGYGPAEITAALKGLDLETLSLEEIVRQAQAKANDIMAQAQVKYREMRKATSDYVEDLMRRTDESMTTALAELRKTRQSLKAAQQPAQQQTNEQ